MSQESLLAEVNHIHWESNLLRERVLRIAYQSVRLGSEVYIPMFPPSIDIASFIRYIEPLISIEKQASVGFYLRIGKNILSKKPFPVSPTIAIRKTTESIDLKEDAITLIRDNVTTIGSLSYIDIWTHQSPSLRNQTQFRRVFSITYFPNHSSSTIISSWNEFMQDSHQHIMIHYSEFGIALIFKYTTGNGAQTNEKRFMIYRNSSPSLTQTRLNRANLADIYCTSLGIRSAENYE